MYTTRVENVMAPDVIVAKPDMSVGQVKEIMLAKGISVVPVVDGVTMVGMVTMTDVVEALERHGIENPVSDLMETGVQSVFKDVSLVEVVSMIGRHGLNALPVVERDGRLIGIVTTGTLVRSLLHQMDTKLKRKEEERLHTYRASHIFEDIVSDDTSVLLRFTVDDKDFTSAGKASSSIKKSLQRLGVKPAFVRRVAVAVYEAEMNLVIHTDVGGEITADIRKDRLLISTVDHGPGIADVGQVLEPGFSTAPEWIRDMGFGAGMGLANIKRCSDSMRLMSERGVGTRLDIMFRLREDSLDSSHGEGKSS